MPRLAPIGPLALFLRALHTDSAQRATATVLAAALTAILLLGVGLLLLAA